MTVAVHVLLQEASPDRPGWKHVVVAIISSPFRKVVRDIEYRRAWRRVFVIYEADTFRGLTVRRTG